MTCREVRDNLSFYLDGMLDERTLEMMEAHIRQCKDCREELASLSAMVQTAGEIMDAEPPAGLKASILAAIHEKEAVCSTKQPVRVSFGLWLGSVMSLRAAKWAAGAVAAGAVVFAVISNNPQHQQQLPRRTSFESPRPSQTASATVSPRPVEHAVQAKVAAGPPVRQLAKASTVHVHETYRVRTPKASHQLQTVASAPSSKRVIHKSTKMQMAHAVKPAQPKADALPEPKQVEVATAPKPEPTPQPASDENIRLASVKVSNGPMISKEDTEKWIADAKAMAAMRKGGEQASHVSFVKARF
ncbi:MAG: anti-sigma factor [Armatimonadota bacterium]|nr:zf-HC2 domain-containing protein [bacterium]